MLSALFSTARPVLGMLLSGFAIAIAGSDIASSEEVSALGDAASEAAAALPRAGICYLVGFGRDTGWSGAAESVHVATVPDLTARA